MHIGLEVKYPPTRLWFDPIFNNFITDVAKYLDTEQTHTPSDK